MACFFLVIANTDSPELLKALYRLSPGLCVSCLQREAANQTPSPSSNPPRTPPRHAQKPCFKPAAQLHIHNLKQWSLFPNVVKDVKSAGLWSRRVIIPGGDFRAELAAFNLDWIGGQKLVDKS